jgi:hypothetical protein
VIICINIYRIGIEWRYMAPTKLNEDVQLGHHFSLLENVSRPFLSAILIEEYFSNILVPWCEPTRTPGI